MRYEVPGPPTIGKVLLTPRPHVPLPESVLSNRKQQILQQCCILLADKGCAAFTMRAVARASGLKLGALQYHFPSRANLMTSFVAYVANAYRTDFDRFAAAQEPSLDALHALLDYMLVETLTATLQTQRLFPQLWAMGLVEPALQEVLDELYESYLTSIEACLVAEGVVEPRGDALAILSMLEGLTLFVDPGRRWEPHAQATVAAIRALINARYGSSSPQPSRSVPQ